MGEPSETVPQVWPLCRTQALGFLSLLFFSGETIAFESICKENTNSWIHVIGMFPAANLAMES